MRPRLGKALLGVAVVLAVAPAGASAHSSAPDVHAEIDRVEPAVPGLRVTVGRSVVDQLIVQNRSATPAEALDITGRAFLRIGRDGVEADLGAPAFYVSLDPTGEAPPPKGVRQSTRPKWVKVSRRDTFAWFDHRLHPGAVRGDDEARRAGRPARLAGITVPLRQGRRLIIARGAVMYRPRLGSVTARLTGGQPAGVQATAVPGVRPGMLLSVTGDQPVEVPGPRGEPFARFDERGIRVNERSALASTLSSGALPVRAAAAPDARPRWRTVSTGRTLAWLDPRLQSGGPEPGYRQARAGRTLVTARWSLPVDVGGVRETLRGETLWRPTAAASGRIAPTVRDAGSGAGLVVLGVLALLVVVGGGAGALVLRRRATA